jgi:glycosyltransferase involved in cell wall biosynthesis
MTVRVLHVVAAGEIGGAERVVADLAGAGADGRSQHAVALFSPLPALGDFLRDSGAQVHDAGSVRENAVGYLHRALGGAATDWLRALLRRQSITVVHLHTFASQVLGTRAARAVGLPVLRTEHSTRVYRNHACWPFSCWSLRRVDAAVAVSAYVRRVALARAPWAAPKMTVIPNGVASLSAAPKANDPPSTASGADDAKAAGPFRFVAVGRLEPRKGLTLALAALARVRAAGVDAVLDIVGDGEDRAALTAETQRLGLCHAVTFHGFQSDPSPLVARADAALSSAREEALGLALLEAMAAGRPVVAVPIGGIPELVTDGQTGWLAAHRSVDALAAVMTDAASDRARARHRGQQARAFVTQRYTRAAMRDQYQSLYERLTEAAGLGNDRASEQEAPAHGEPQSAVPNQKLRWRDEGGFELCVLDGVAPVVARAISKEILR